MTYEIGNNLKIYLAGHPGFHFPFLGLPLILSHFFAVVANLFGGYWQIDLVVNGKHLYPSLPLHI
ncbi:hypothetical protein QUF81_25545 [Peribacillus simplex]|uniref:Uncharacterized protein n=1 Tax=Peribacillus simplex TaxID=1478 RepID=A0AAW7IZ26_9BACI|nr:hypothetical protein [Peribacillus simplex]MDM5296447.1 hypothetical protein [Peribacillus simplex]MDM5455487.1 hypothetical protein [Peribacillus simplex]